MKTTFISWLLVLCVAANIAEAHQQHGPMTIADLTRNAAMVVEGEVEAVSSQWNASRTQIHTTVRIFVTEYHKGGRGREVIEFRFLGGTVFDETLAVVGQPAFAVGENVMVFMKPQWEQADAPLVEMEHGKLTIQLDSAGREMAVSGAGEAYSRSEVAERIREINAAGREAKR